MMHETLFSSTEGRMLGVGLALTINRFAPCALFLAILLIVTHRIRQALRG